MQTFSEIAHPRAVDGRFTAKGFSEAAGGVEADLSDPFAEQRARVQARKAESRAEQARTDALIGAAASGDAEVSDRILAHLDPQERRKHVAAIAQAEDWASWLEDDPGEHSYALSSLPDGAQISSLADAEDFRDFDGVNFVEYGTALAEAWRAETQRLSREALGQS